MSKETQIIAMLAVWQLPGGVLLNLVGAPWWASVIALGVAQLGGMTVGRVRAQWEAGR